MSSNYPELVFTEDEDFTADRLNAAMRVLDQRLRSLEPFTPSWEAAVNDLRAVGLSRLNDAILPAYERVQLLATLGFLFAGSNTELTLVQDQSATFTINDETQRALFTPTPFLAITRAGTVDDYAIAQLVSYDNDTGQLMVVVKAVVGNAGPHSDWQIGALAGNTLAAMAYFAQIDAARATAVAAKDTSVNNAAQTGADRIQTGLDRVAAAKSAAAAAQSEANAKVWDPTLYALKTEIDTRFTNLVNAAPAALDTLKELADALGGDANFSATITAALGNRLRFDAPQTLTTEQKQQAQANLSIDFSPYLTKAGGTMTGDLTVYRSSAPTTGVIFLGNTGSRYLHYDGSNYIMPGGSLYVNGYQVLTTDNFSTNPFSAFVQSVRLVYAADTSVNSSAISEPYGGAVMTGFGWSGVATTQARFRYLQYQINGSWYTAGYA